MDMQPLKIQLFPKDDTDGQTFYIGKLCFPGTINLGRGNLFFIYLQDDIKELHICPIESIRMYDPAKYFSKRRKSTRSRHNNIAVELETCYNQETRQEFFSGSIAVDVTVNASEGIVFLVFVADTGEEELQISVGNNKKQEKRKSPDILKKRRVDNQQL